MKLTVCIGLLSFFVVQTATAQVGIVRLQPCIAAPDDSTEDVVMCYDNACLAYQLAYAACETNACRNAAALDYSLNLNACQLSMTAPIMPVGRESWITLSFADGEWSYRFDGLAAENGIVFQY
ncbi:MAG: hypothetical protein AB8C13_01030 [Phycisphaerales bacterium]